MAFVIMCLLVAAVMQSGRSLPGLAKHQCAQECHCEKSGEISHTCASISMYYWHFCWQTLPLLHWLWEQTPSALLAIVFVASLPILLTATLFTIEQMFLRYPDFRLTGREVLWQAVGLLLISHWGVAFFLSCICFLLLLNKAGKTGQSVSGVASFLMSHVILAASRSYICDDSSLIIVPTDKGPATVVMDRQAYDSKVTDMLSDLSTYDPVVKDLAAALQTRMNALLLSLRPSNHISQQLYDCLRCSAGRIPFCMPSPKSINHGQKPPSDQ